jgi:hypothetical protein
MGNRLSKIYTRTGDEGTTGLGDGTRVPKDSLRVEAYGTVDECNSAVGMVLAVPDVPADIRDILTQVQHDLFDLGGELCIPGHRAILDRHVERPAAGKPRRPVTWHAPSRVAPSATAGRSRARRRWRRSRCATSTGCRTCCS